MTDEIVTYDGVCQSSVSDEILKTDCLCYRGRVSEQQNDPVNRLERRKQRTRAALIQAAQAFIAAGKFNVPVLEITQAADVGMGSFYNHFDSKEELFEAAVADVLDTHGALLDQLTARSTTPPRRSHAASGSPAGCFGDARRRVGCCWPTGFR